MAERRTATARRRRRPTIALIVVFALVAAFVGRLVDVQLVEARGLDAQAASTQQVTETLPGLRGAIVARDGTVLAASVPRYDVTAAPVHVAAFTGTLGGTRTKRISVATALAAIARAADVPGATAATMRAAIRADPSSQFAYLAKGLTVAEHEAVSKLDVPWVYSIEQTQRSYPDGAAVGNLTGFVGTDGAQAGLELADDTCLAGHSGSETYDRSGSGVALPGTTRVVRAARDGDTLRTTIDADMQYQAEQDIATAGTSMGAQSATAIVMDAHTGAVRALADWPTVDPDDVTPTAEHDPAALGSQALTAAYEPGSTIKAVTAAALLQEGAATPTSSVSVPDTRTFPWGGTIGDAEAHPTEPLTLTGVLAQSSNVGITLLGQRLSEQTRYRYLKAFGLFQQDPALTFPGQPSWPQQQSPTWDAQTDVNSMFGQGITATALQVAGVYQTLANGGVRVSPHIVEGCADASGRIVSDEPHVTSTRVVSATTAQEVVDMLQSTTDPAADGTLSNMQPIPGYTLSLKTGTAQIALSGGRGYGPDTIVSVEGMVPAADPRWIVAVAFTKPQTSKLSSVAAPAFRALTSQVLERYRVPPGPGATTYPTRW